MDRRNRTGKDNPNWRGNRHLLNGYWMIYMPEHPRATTNGYVREHIVIAEKALGKPLPKGVQVHHCGVRGDNTKLVLCEDQAYHSLLHQRMRGLKACGHASWRKCWICGKYDKPENLWIIPRSGRRIGEIVRHKQCHNKYERERNLSGDKAISN